MGSGNRATLLRNREPGRQADLKASPAKGPQTGQQNDGSGALGGSAPFTIFPLRVCESWINYGPLSDGVTVAQGPLEAFVMVRIHVGQPTSLPRRGIPNPSAKGFARTLPRQAHRQSSAPCVVAIPKSFLR